MAGELGHMTIEPGATDPCNCGKNGCLEAIASSWGMVRQYSAASGLASRDHVRLNDIFERAREGDSLALGMIDRASKACIGHLSPGDVVQPRYDHPGRRFAARRRSAASAHPARDGGSVAQFYRVDGTHRDRSRSGHRFERSSVSRVSKRGEQCRADEKALCPAGGDDHGFKRI
ncbi:MAG: hypothetical protein DMG57_15425 [Acidobacteria bacterium]|nr:MAG: hypothetical protein DMG57_15425 [Acidobacteriota bacterium]